jgi:putative oxidoreductase
VKRFLRRTDVKTERKDLGIALLRLVVGGVFVAHGAQKLFTFGIPGLAGMFDQMGLPFPTLSAVAVTAAEFLGGLALVAGFGTRLAALPLAFSMLVAAVTVHLKGGFFLPNGVEYVLVLFAATVALALAGSGVYSVDGLLARRREESEPLERPVARPAEVR